MSQFDLIGVSNGTCVEPGPRLGMELLENLYRADNGSLQAGTRMGKAAKQAAASAATTRSRPLAHYAGGSALNAAPAQTGTALGGIGTCIAAVLTKALMMPLLGLPRKARAHVRRLRCERSAMEPAAWSKADLLDAAYDATLDRLGNKRNEPTWWRKVLLTAEGNYILPCGTAEHAGPHHLRIDSVRQWLSDYHVRADLKALATERILADGTDTAGIRARLAQSYAHYTFNDPMLAEAPIETVLCGLVAGALCSLAPSEQMMVSLIRQSNRRINRANAEILAAISRTERKLASRSLEAERRRSEHDSADVLPAQALASISFDFAEAAA